MEVKHDDFPWKRTGTSITGQSTGSFCTDGGAVSKAASVAEGACTFVMTDTHGDRICCQYGAGEFKITVNGEPVATNTTTNTTNTSNI
jgi:hypothetical protein